MGSFSENKPYWIATVIVVLSFLLGAGRWYKAGRSSAQARLQTEQMKSTINSLAADNSAHPSELQRLDQDLAAMKGRFETLKAKFSFGPLDSLQPQAEGADMKYHLGNMLDQVAARLAAVMMVKKASYDQKLGILDVQSLQPEQIPWYLREIAIIEFVIRKSVESDVLVIKQIQTTVPQPNQMTRKSGKLVDEVNVNFVFQGDLNKFMQLLGSLQKDGEYLFIKKYSLRRQDKSMGNLLEMNVELSALIINDPDSAAASSSGGPVTPVEPDPWSDGW